MPKRLNVPRIHWPTGAASMVMLAAAAAGCTSSLPNTSTFMADPGQYEFYTCKQIGEARASTQRRRDEVKALIDKAVQGRGGAFVSAVSYRIEYASLGEELKVLDVTARAKNCPPPPVWSSNTAVR